MQTLAERFFTGAEQQRIRTAAVQAVEARTSGEVVVMVTSASHGYPEAGLLAAAALALPAALATAFTTAGLLWWRGGQHVAVPAALHPLFRAPAAAGRPFSLPAAAFPAPRADGGRGRAGRLHPLLRRGSCTPAPRGHRRAHLPLSVLERRVWILGDRGISARIQRRAGRNSSIG